MPVRFSAVATYGVKAMVDLALHEGQGPIPTAAIAKRHAISTDCLEQVLHRLRRAGLVAAARGARGGYQLSRRPAQVSVADIAHALEAPPRRRPRPAARASGEAVDQVTSAVWTRIETAVTTALATTSLAELAAEARRRQTHHAVNHTFTFYI